MRENTPDSGRIRHPECCPKLDLNFLHYFFYNLNTVRFEKRVRLLNVNEGTVNR